MTKRLRPEARPAQWGHLDDTQLDDTQKKAFKDIVRMLNEAVTDLSSTAAKNTPTKDCTTWMSANRSSRTVFLSGGRGTGKTTLLLSLVNATQKGSPLPKMEEKDQDVRECLERIRPSIIWLEPIDMETMPPDANLLAAILVRIDEAVRCFGGQRSIAGRQESRPRNLLGGPDYHDALLELQRLQSDSSLAWSGNLPAREGALDPDSYAVEVFRSERARLALNHRLEQTLSALAEQAFTCAEKRNPLFVLPVDDIDLNPLACLDLLKLLRLISVPQLFTLLLGDLRVAEMVLNLKLSNDMGGLVKDVRYPEMIALRPDSVGAFAGDIAANALRKLLPPSQRVELKPMTLREGLEFLPLGEGDREQQLYKLLANCLVDVPTEVASLFSAGPTSPPAPGMTLRDFLLIKASALDTKPAPVMSETDEPKLLEVGDLVYAGVKLFETTPRRLADLWLELQRIGKQGETEPGRKEMMDYLARLSLASLTGETILSPLERTIITNGFAPNPKLYSGWELGRLPFDVYNRVEVYPAIKAESMSSGQPVCIYLSESKDWYMQVRDVLPKESPAHPESVPSLAMGIATVPQLPDGLSPRLIRRSTLAELVTFHDLWMLGPDGNRRISPLLPDLSATGGGWGNAEWGQGDKSVLLPWLVPQFQSFWEFDLFLGAWNQFVRKVESLDLNDNRRVSLAFFTWICAGTAVVDGKAMVKLPSYYDQIDWKPIVKRLKALTHSPLRRSELARHWLVRVAVMLMPETGLPEDISKFFSVEPDTYSDANWLNSFWQEQRQAITHLRALRLAELVRKDLDDVAKKLWEFPLAFDPNHNFKLSRELVYKMARKEMPPPETPPSESSPKPSSETSPAATGAVSRLKKKPKAAKKKPN